MLHTAVYIPGTTAVLYCIHGRVHTHNSSCIVTERFRTILIFQETPPGTSAGAIIAAIVRLHVHYGLGNSFYNRSLGWDPQTGYLAYAHIAEIPEIERLYCTGHGHKPPTLQHYNIVRKDLVLLH